MTAEHSSAAAGVHRFFLQDELVLFSEGRRRLFRLNSSGAFIWCCMEEGLSADGISSRFAETFGISAGTAERDVREILTHWRDSGLLAGGEAVPGEEVLLVSDFISSTGKVLPVSSRPTRSYDLAGRSYLVVFADCEIEEVVHPVLAHLERSNPAGIYAGSIEISRTEPSGFVVVVGTAIECCGTLAELVPLVHGSLLMAACEAPGCLAVLHAAAVSDGKRCLLFPGDSGSGKSTLAAAMVGSGLVFFSDEVALLTHSPFRVLPAPLSFSLKEGSWTVLTAFFPGIGNLPIYLRPDRKRVRYLPPPAGMLHQDAGLPVAGIVFPRYTQGASVEIVPISPPEALCRIAQGGYDLNGRFDAGSIGELVSWISRVPCFELIYADLHQAVTGLRGLL